MSAMGAFFTSPTVRRILAKRSFSLTPGTDDEVLHARVGQAQAVRSPSRGKGVCARVCVRAAAHRGASAWRDELAMSHHHRARWWRRHGGPWQRPWHGASTTP